MKELFCPQHGDSLTQTYCYLRKRLVKCKGHKELLTQTNEILTSLLLPGENMYFIHDSRTTLAG